MSLRDHRKTVYTKGRSGYLPGGVCLREAPSGVLVAHSFTREAGSLEPNAYFWGHYGDAAMRGYSQKATRIREDEIVTEKDITEKGL